LASFSNLWTQGGFFPFGVLGVLLPLQMVMFAYEGLELIGVSAGETENPEKVLPHAINSVIYWMLVLYIGALLIIMSLVAWNQLDPDISPFVLVFEKLGIPVGAGIINFVVITAAASSCNSGIFSTGRMLYSLARVGQAPQTFGKVNSRKVPAAGVTASATIMLTGVALNYIVPERVFVYVTSISLLGSLWTWVLIVIAHLGTARLSRPARYGRSHTACLARLIRIGSWWRSSCWSRYSLAWMMALGSLSMSLPFGSPSLESDIKSRSRGRRGWRKTQANVGHY
jgi:AAT family amino acid transporter/D-serine/D-alanine/glycine transporter